MDDIWPDGFIKWLISALIVVLGSMCVIAVYIVWSAFFEMEPWELCLKMETDAAKLQCIGGLE